MQRPAPPTRRVAVALGLLALCIVGFGLRTWNIDWDRGTHQHPDERYWSFVTADIEAPASVGQYLDGAVSPLNPYNSRDTWVYGTLPLFTTKATATWLVNDGPVASTITGGLDLVGVDLVDDDGVLRFDNEFESQLVGRLISALFDTATIGVVFLLGRRLGGSIVGLVGAGLQAFAVLHIQYSHFYGAETIAAFFATVAVLFAVRLARDGPSDRLVVGAGLVVGAAVAAKLSTAAVAVAPVVAIGVAYRSTLVRLGLALRSGARAPVVGLGRLVGHVGLFGLSALVVFKVAQPYAFGQWWGLRLDQRYLDDLDYLTGVNDGSSNVPWTIQWIGRQRLLGPLQSAFWWGLGPGLGLLVAVGAVLTVRRLWLRREWWLSVPLAFIAVEIAFVAAQFNGLIRYMLPAYPTAIALAGWAVVDLCRRASRTSARPLLGRIGAAVALGAVVATVVWAAAFTSGVYGNQHSRLAATEWIVENIPAGSTVTHSLWDDALPLRTVDAAALELATVELDPFAADSSAKVETLIDSLDKADYVIEASNRIYDAVPRFPARYPATVAYYEALFAGTLGFEQVAEFTNEPSVFGISIDDARAEETFTVYDHPTVTIWAKTGDWSAARARALIDPDRADNGFDTTHADAGANALQLTPSDYEAQQSGGTFTDVFDDDGVATTAPWLWWFLWLEVAALAAVPWTTWLFRHLPSRGYAFSKVLGLVAVALPAWVLVATGTADQSDRLAWLVLAAAVGLGASIGWRRRHDLAADWRTNRRSWLAAEAMFVIFFALVLVFRFANPDLWAPFTGGEKPLELSYFTAVTRSTTLPAYDPWFAGGAMNYYYFGYFALAVPTRALHLPPEIAFNLGLPTVAAMAAATTFGIGQSLGALVRPAANRARIGVGAVATVFLLGIGNLDAARQKLGRLGSGQEFDWWAPSRVNDGTFDITEFPFWSMLFGDLHPHVMGMAFLGLVAALGLGYFTASRVGDYARSIVFAVGLGLATGVVRMAHTWDLPAAALVTVGAVGAGQLVAAGPQGVRVRRAIWHLGLAAVVHRLLVAPYVAAGETFDNGVGEPPVTTRLIDFLSQFGLFVAIAVAYLVVRAIELTRRRAGDGVASSAAVGTAVVLATVVGSRFSAVAALCAALVVALVALPVIDWRSPVEPVDRHTSGPVAGHMAVSGLLALGFAIAGGVDVVTVDNDVERLNTVFKFWYQSWHFLAIGGAIAVFHVTTSIVPALSVHPRSRAAARRHAVAIGSFAVIVALVVASFAYPVFAPPARLDDRFAIIDPTLDGLAFLDADPIYVDAGRPIPIGDDLVLIEWLRENVEGTPTIVESVGPLYGWTSRMSIYTGLPTVLGWDWHQTQQRRAYVDAIDQRRADVQRLYSTTDPAMISRVLRRYDIAYVVVGTQEHVYGSPAGLATLAGHSALDLAFGTGDYAIYEVDKAALAAE